MTTSTDTILTTPKATQVASELAAEDVPAVEAGIAEAKETNAEVAARKLAAQPSEKKQRTASRGRTKLSGKATRSVVTEAWDRGLPVDQIAVECGMTVERVQAFLNAARKGFATPEALEASRQAKAADKPVRAAKPAEAKPATPGVRGATVGNPKPLPKDLRDKKIPAGSMIFQLSEGLYSLIAGDKPWCKANATAFKKLSAAEKVRLGKAVPKHHYLWPVTTTAEATSVAKKLATIDTAIAARYAERIPKEAKAAAK
jgi:hypothetical protein